MRTDSGDIIKTDNMTLYYQVEKGKTYNATYEGMWFRGIVGEVQ